MIQNDGSCLYMVPFTTSVGSPAYKCLKTEEDYLQYIAERNYYLQHSFQVVATSTSDVFTAFVGYALIPIAIVGIGLLVVGITYRAVMVYYSTKHPKF